MSPTEEVVEELLPIEARLDFVLFGLECALGVSFSGAEWERVFRDAADDQISAKHYVFFESSRLAVTGRVDDYEPESVWIQVKGISGARELLRRVVEGADCLDFRLRQRSGEERDS